MVSRKTVNSNLFYLKTQYYFFSIYRQYHGEIIKRVAPTMRAIAKKRKKKEQEDLANANKLTKIQEVNIIEKENDRKIETNSIPPPSNNRIASPLPNLVNKQSNQIQSLSVKGMKNVDLFLLVNIFFLVEITPSTKEDLTKKKKIKQPSTIVSKQTSKLVSIKVGFFFNLYYFILDHLYQQLKLFNLKIQLILFQQLFQNKE